jgi:hypothetical protein
MRTTRILQLKACLQYQKLDPSWFALSETLGRLVLIPISWAGLKSLPCRLISTVIQFLFAIVDDMEPESL